MILSESVLYNAAQEAHTHFQYKYSQARFDEKGKYDLFISHSFKDQDLVNGLYYLFQKAGYHVYVDWIDDSNLDRKNVTPETAAIIRKRIAGCRGLAYIATGNTTTSRWCPWELGVSDGMHGRACILPVMSAPFKGQEYLGLYPYLKYDRQYGSSKYDFFVWNQKKYIIRCS